MRLMRGGPPISEIDVATFEERFKILLPPSYREFLLRTNGGCPERDVFSVPGFDESPSNVQMFLGLRHPIGACNLDEAREALADRIPSHLLVIASTPGADEICISLSPDAHGAIYYWDGVHISPTYGRFYLVAKSFDEFLEQLYRDEDSPKAEDYDVN